MDREKELLRKKFAAIRRKLSHETRKRADKRICTSILRLPKVANSNIICAFFSLPTEVNIAGAIGELFRRKKTVVLPKVSGDDLEIREIRSPEDVVVGAYRVLEPDDRCPKISKHTVDVFLVPGLCFDSRGFRIGWGKGYYDRLLEGVEAVKIGVAYQAQVVAHVPHTSYDVPMDIVVTERKVVLVG